MRKPILITIAVTLMFTFTMGGFSTSTAAASAGSAAGAYERHPLIRKALAALQLAAADLEDASHDFCGHRVDALQAVEVAIDQLGLAIACDPKPASAQAISYQNPSSFAAASTRERHPDIRKAIAALHLAADDLSDASHDFCGHRVDALAATEGAIYELGLALACDRQQ
jgi:hypothetical protein